MKPAEDKKDEDTMDQRLFWKILNSMGRTREP